jgi:hypothetical protein
MNQCLILCLSLFQNTYTNAEKLLAAAEELAQTGECNAEDIYRYTASLHLIILPIAFNGPYQKSPFCLSQSWIRMFLGFLDPDSDPFVKGMDPDPSITKQK